MLKALMPQDREKQKHLSYLYKWTNLGKHSKIRKVPSKFKLIHLRKGIESLIQKVSKMNTVSKLN